MLTPACDPPPRRACAEAARRNGARSRGPVTPQGKARSSRNALRHGLAARSLVLLPGEDQAAYAELEAELLARYAPQDALRTFLVQQLAASMWRPMRAARLEAEEPDEAEVPDEAAAEPNEPELAAPAEAMAVRNEPEPGEADSLISAPDELPTLTTVSVNAVVGRLATRSPLSRIMRSCGWRRRSRGRRAMA